MRRLFLSASLALSILLLAASNLHSQDVVGTGEIAARGLKNSDFPRITKLADRVCAYEQVDPIKRIVTVNNLIGHDLVAYLPRQTILWMSEVFSNRIFPSMANSNPSEWLDTLNTAERMDVGVYVPAHGFIDSPAILKEEERNFHLALERVYMELDGELK